MPEGSYTKSGLEGVLDHLADYSLNIRNYQTIQNAVEAEKNIKIHVAEKLLSICIRGLKEDMKCTSHTLNIISCVINKVRTGQCFPTPDLVPSALAVMHLLKTTALFNKVEALKILAFDVIMAYPEETLILLAVDQSTEFLELFSSYSNQRISEDLRLKALSLIPKLLKILSPDKRRQFVKQGVSVWFSKVIPIIVDYVIIQNAKVDVPIKAMEMLTEDLVYIEYIDNPQWQIVLECIYTPKRYPLIMKNLLEKDNNAWCRLWIVFIKLLKNQITKVNNSMGSPINAMLPVVEMAFKMDPKNRCRAFRCWNVLITNFSTENSDSYINKRIKLLMIPLLSNNAKVVETALAKLETWWHLIIEFDSKIDKVGELVLIPFLHFCFGKPHTDKPILIPGMFSDETKHKSIQAMVEIFGHTDICKGCGTIPKLRGKLITEKLLINHWSTWMRALENLIKISAQSSLTVCESHVKCVWFSLLSTIDEIKDNKLKQDLYYEIVSFLDKVSVDANGKLAEIILFILIPTLFSNHERISTLTIKDGKRQDIQKIISILLKLPKETLNISQEAVNTLSVVTDYILKAESSQGVLETILANVPTKGLLLWTTLAESICKHKHILSSEMLCKLLLSPLQEMNSDSNAFKQTLLETTWINLYNYVADPCQSINENIIEVLTSYDSDIWMNKLCIRALTEIIKMKMRQEGTNIKKEVELLLQVTEAPYLLEWIKARENLEIMFKVVINIVKKFKKIDDGTIIENVMTISKNILQHTLNNEFLHESTIINHLEDLFRTYELAQEAPKYSSIKLSNINELKDIGTKLIQKIESNDKEHNLRDNILNIKRHIKSLHNNPKTLENKDCQDQVSFTEPKTQVATKKLKKKVTTIINTVVESGEEYVVVKSNWKFNPKKLTDNQREKLKKKREDIPALYQDLSQSQEEFKLSTWKTDSQDNSTTSKSTSLSASEDFSTILKNIPNSDIVPKILENIKPSVENVENNTTIDSNEKKGIMENEKTEDIETNNKSVMPKDIKSPRMALKDRVFRNVRNLIEKTSLSNGNKSLSCDPTENEPKTPSNKSKDIDSITHSAPSKISADRPSRLKRKPKKFDDLSLFSIKKRRNSTGLPCSPTTETLDIEMAKIHGENENIVLETSCTDVNEKGNKDESLDDIGKILKSPKIAVIADQKIVSINCQENEEVNSTSEIKIDSENLLSINKTDDMQNNKEKHEVVINEKPIEKINEEGNANKCKINMSTPKSSNKVKENEGPKSSIKKSGTKRSRIEKELAIDTVEGHPLLNNRPEKRLTRKSLSNPQQTRKSLTDKLNKNKPEAKSKSDKSNKEKDTQPISQEIINSEDILASQDVIESSQDSTITTISMKSTITNKKVPVVCLTNLIMNENNVLDTQDLLDDVGNEPQLLESNTNDDNKDDTELPRNKTAVDDDKSFVDLTENMNTEPVSENESDIIIIDKPSVLSNTENINSEPELENTADADTQSMDPIIIIDLEKEPNINSVEGDDSSCNKLIQPNNDSILATPEDITLTIENIENEEESKFSPFKDEEQRKKDFLNNTIEISPIKTLSPVGEKKSPPHETSNDYVVIKLTSAVQSNGEPFDKCDSPEVFTEDKVSPDKRDLSPPRQDIVVSNTSPSSSLSLKKNRPQVRSGGRGAQMLGLCVPNRLQNVLLSDKSTEVDEKKSTPMNTSARRNLRILYGAPIENDVGDENDNSDNFLKLRRSLPATDCSPSGPILKRKLAEITDDSTISPASKRKRVSFHDPPVSTTICVKKYIEPCGVRSPSNSVVKRQERQMRAQIGTKSPKRLDNLFKLDSALTKTIESFVDGNTAPDINEDTDMSTIDPTPVAEVVSTSELNDTDPICVELIDCSDSIEKIAIDLSSPTMSTLLVKEFEGKIDTVGDLAKMTELEINRLSLKTPKVEVAKNVLFEYAQRIKNANDDITPTVEAAMLESIVPEFRSMEVQTNEIVRDNVGIQTDVKPDITNVSTQSKVMETSHCSVQTHESGSKSTNDIVKLCLLERPNFVSSVCEQTDETFKTRVAESLSVDVITDLLVKKLSETNCSHILNRILDHQSTFGSSDAGDKRLSLLQDILCDKFETRDLILFCSEILKKTHDKI